MSLGGRVFLIEEDGFQALDTYLLGLKQRFATDPSTADLLTDIEASLSEKFTERVMLSRSEVVTHEDVQAVMRVMGRVEEIAGEDPVSAPFVANTVNAAEACPRKLYRDEEDRVIAGVGAGLAAYFGVQPLVIRVLFLVLACLNGFGIVLYVILWIVLPRATTNDQKLEMRGKPVTIESIEHLVREKAQKLDQKMKGDSTLVRILNLPIIFIAAVARAIRAFFRVLGPILSIFVGIGILLGTLLGITAATVIAVMLIFPINSTLFVSDLPLKELMNQPLYGAGIVAGYFLALIPLLFLLLLAITLMRRRNMFRLLPTAILIGLWIMAASVGALALREIGPWAYERTQELKREATTTQTYPETDFRGIASSGNVRVHVKRGDAYAIQLTGLKNNLKGMHVVQEQGILYLRENRPEQSRCLFCFHKELLAEITIPELTSYQANEASRVTIEGFTQDLTLAVRDAARLEVVLLGQAVTSSLQGVGKLTLHGTATRVVATASDASRLDAQSLDVATATITTEDVARVQISPRDQLEATSKDASRIEFEGEATTTTRRELGNSRIHGPENQENQSIEE